MNSIYKMSNMYRYTTEHINDNDVLVRVYKKGERKIHEKFFVNDHGDWNTVEHHIEQELLLMEQYG